MPPRHYVSLDDDSEFVMLPEPVVDEAFHSGLWEALNKAFDLSIDAYEGAEIPLAVMGRCADFLREWVAALTPLGSDTVPVLNEVARLLDHGAVKGVLA